MDQSSVTRVDRDALLAMIASSKDIPSTKKHKQQVFDLLVSCNNIDEENNLLNLNEKVSLLFRLTHASHSCQKYLKVIEYGSKLLTLEITPKQKGFIFFVIGFSYHGIGQCEEAIDYFEKNLNISKELGDKVMESMACAPLGALYCEVGQYEKALDYYKRKLEISTDLGDKGEERAACDYLGDVYRKICQHGEALDYCKRSLEISIDLGDKVQERNACSTLGAVYRDIDKYEEAVDYYKKSLEISTYLGDQVEERNAFSNLGSVYGKIGKCEKELDYHKRSLDISTRLGDKVEERHACANLGPAYSKIGQYEEALVYQERALKISEELGDKSGEAVTCGDLGNLYVKIAQHEKALECYERCLEITIDLGNRKLEGWVCGALGEVYRIIGKYGNALDCYKRRLEISTDLGDKAEEGKAYADLANFYSTTGNVVEAINYQYKYVENSVQQKNRVDLTDVSYGMGMLMSGIGEYEEVLKTYFEDLKLAIDRADKEAEAGAHWNLGITYYRLGEYDESVKNLSRSIVLRDNLRCFSERDEFNIAMAQQDFWAHVILMECLLKLKCINKALLVFDVGKSKALFDLLKLSAMNTSPVDGRCTKWIEEMPSIINAPERDSHAEISANVCSSLRDGSVVVFGFDKSDNLLIWVLKEQETFLRKWSPSCNTAKKFFEKIVRNVTSGFGEQSSRLDLEDKRDAGKERNKKMLYQSLEQERKVNVEVFGEMHVLQNELKESLLSSEKNEDDMANDTNIANDVTDNERRDYLRHAYNALIAPVHHLLSGSKLAIVPDDILFRLPFSALVDNNGDYLCDHYSTQIIPALHTLNFILEHPAKPLGPALFVGNPTLGSICFGDEVINLPTLRYAEKEAAKFARAFQAQPLLKEHATKQNVLDRIKNASIVHIAAHGNMDYGEIFLAPNPGTPSPAEEQHYLLMPEDISKCSLSARLVVLSCCHSGRGEISSEGVVGTARAFLGAGARAVLVALWQLPDEMTKNLLHCFYNNIIKHKQSVCVALQEAIKSSKAKDDFPENWAPFQIFGEDVLFTKEDLREILRQCKAMSQ